MQKSRRKYSSTFVVGQTAMEYLLLLGIMVVIALTAFRNLLPEAFIQTNAHFDIAATNIIGSASDTHMDGPFP